MKNKVCTWASHWALFLSLWCGFSGLLWAQRTPPPESDFPVFGIGAGQKFRFAVSGVGTTDGLADSSQICHAALSFRDTQNRPISGLYREVSLRSNQGAFLELDAGAFSLRPRARIDFRPVLTAFSDSGSCASSFSVLDFIGRIVAFETPGPTAVLKLFPPPICPILSQIFGVLLPPLGTGQTLQVQVVRSTLPFDVNNMPLPCDVTLQILKGFNVVLASQATGPLLPGQAAMVSVNANTLNLGFGETAFLGLNVIETSVNILLPGFGERTCPATSGAGCILSYQVVENLTNWTMVISAP